MIIHDEWIHAKHHIGKVVCEYRGWIMGYIVSDDPTKKIYPTRVDAHKTAEKLQQEKENAIPNKT